MQTEKWSAVMICPHCSQQIQTEMGLTVDAMFVNQVPKYERPREERFSSEECSFLLNAENSGVLQAFKDAVTRIKGANTPKDTDKFFLGYVRTCMKKRVPQPYMDRLIQMFPDSTIGIYGSQQILMVTANKTPRLFVPDEFSSNEESKMAALHLTECTGRLDSWIRTKYGYVADKGIVFEIFKAKSAGEFARPAL